VRDVLLTVIFLIAIPYVLAKAHRGIYVWSWLSYMNPHRFAYGFAFSFPFAQLTAIATAIAMIFGKEKPRFIVTPLIVVWAVFLLWILVTTLFALEPELARPQLVKVLKIQLMTFLTIFLIATEDRLRTLIWVIVGSIGFFGVKGGLFTILTGGEHIVWGPIGTFIEDNNELALSTLMVLPLCNYLRVTTSNRWVKLLLLLAMILMMFSVLGSRSRGCFLAGMVGAAYMWLKSNRKFWMAVGLLVVLGSMFSFAPDKWFDRMSTIQTYEEDGSAMSRINVWKFSIRMANDRLTGGGLDPFSPATFSRYADDASVVRSSHSIYFGILAEHGWPGLIMYMTILLAAIAKLRKVGRQFGSEDTTYNRDVINLAFMLETSLVVFMVGGAFYSLAYFDLSWHLIAAAVILGALSPERSVKSLEEESVSADDKSVLQANAR
jgi:probable O-glycosylation ligase (exosortase A-associated)